MADGDTNVVESASRPTLSHVYAVDFSHPPRQKKNDLYVEFYICLTTKTFFT